MKPIRVLIIDDSLFMRRLLTEMLGQDSRIHVVGAAPDALVARSMIKRYEPDVLTLDINMPRMCGLDFLERLMRLRPTPVVMFAALGIDGAKDAVRALSLGAVEVVSKPCSGTYLNWKELADELIAKVKFAAAVQIQCRSRRSDSSRGGHHASTGGHVQERVVAIGASTGGVQALHQIISRLPADCPPIMIAQHMPPHFTSSFANRLDANSALIVREAADGDVLLPGHAYVAPGDRHLLLGRDTDGYVCRLSDEIDDSGHMPSADTLFKSVASNAGAAAMGIVLSGMGKDGANGLMHILQSGGITIAQNRATSLIYGMPKAARDSGAALYECALSKIPQMIVDIAPRGRVLPEAEMALSGELR